MSSLLANKIANLIAPLFNGRAEVMRPHIINSIDVELTQIRNAVKDESLARCPIVSHHTEPCAFCIVAALREVVVMEP